MEVDHALVPLFPARHAWRCIYPVEIYWRVPSLIGGVCLIATLNMAAWNNRSEPDVFSAAVGLSVSEPRSRRSLEGSLDPKNWLSDEKVSDDFLDIGIGRKRLPQLQIIGTI